MQNARTIKTIKNITRKPNAKQRKNKRLNISTQPNSVPQYKGQREIGTRLNVNPVKLRGNDIKLAEQFRALKLSEYLYGALHPAQAVHEGLDVKLPSDLPVPTACIRVTYTVTLSPGANGFLCVNYVPGSLIGTNITLGECSTLSANTTCDGVGNAGINSFVRMPFRSIPQVYDRWRLTASEMNLQYQGKVLDQSGVMHSCVHYELPTVAVKGSTGAGTITGLSNGDIDRLSGSYDLVKQGLWNSTVDISQNGHGVTHVYTPSSIDDFEYTGRVGSSGGSFNFSFANNGLSILSSQIAQTQTMNGNFARQYIWACSNLPPSVPNMLFTVSEVYEYFPDIGSVPILKLTESGPYRDWETDRKSTRLNSSH